MRDARVICVDLREGKVLWTYRTNSHVECTPVDPRGPRLCRRRRRRLLLLRLSRTPTARPRRAVARSRREISGCRNFAGVEERRATARLRRAGRRRQGAVRARCRHGPGAASRESRLPGFRPAGDRRRQALSSAWATATMSTLPTNWASRPAAPFGVLTLRSWSQPLLPKSRRPSFGRATKAARCCGVAISGDEGFYLLADGTVTAFDRRTGKALALAHAGRQSSPRPP